MATKDAASVSAEEKACSMTSRSCATCSAVGLAAQRLAAARMLAGTTGACAAVGKPTVDPFDDGLLHMSCQPQQHAGASLCSIVPATDGATGESVNSSTTW